MRGIIIFQSRYGATRQYANWISRALEIPAAEAGEVTQARLAAADFIILGTSIYIGRMLLRSWMEQHAPLLKGKPLFLFAVCATKAEQQEKLNSYVVQNVPAQLLTHCHRYFYPGKIQYRELSFTDKLKVRAGGLMARLMGKPLDISDFNRIDETLAAPLVADVQSFHQHQNP